MPEFELAISVEQLIEEVKTKTQGRQRQELRMQIAKHVRQREESRVGGRLKAL
jgi:hypothetical protein